MINEKIRAEELLNGVSFNKKYFYTAYIILIKYFHYQCYSPLRIRELILEWENKYKHKHFFDLNLLIKNIVDSNDEFHDDCNVKINQGDIDLIKQRFDNKNVQKLALGLLCYFKSRKTNKLYISIPALSQFTGISYDSIKKYYLPMLIGFEFCDKIQNENFKWGWQSGSNSKTINQIQLKLNYEYTNDGKYILIDNKLNDLFKKCFEK